jgi:hypothetical protein
MTSQKKRDPTPRARFIAFCLVIVGAALMPARHAEQRESDQGAPPTMTASRWSWSGRWPCLLAKRGSGLDGHEDRHEGRDGEQSHEYRRERKPQAL